jgi:hypothetical protein
MAKAKPPARLNPFQPRPPILLVGDADPRTLVPLIGQITTSWENAEIGYSYIYSTLLNPVRDSQAARRAYGSIISAVSRKATIESAAEVFFHKFPNETLEEETAHLLNVYIAGASRRNDVAHGVITNGIAPRTGWFVESNFYSNKRDIDFKSPYAYTSSQLSEIAKRMTALRFDTGALQDALKVHFLSCDPKLRGRY